MYVIHPRAFQLKFVFQSMFKKDHFVSLSFFLSFIMVWSESFDLSEVFQLSEGSVFQNFSFIQEFSICYEKFSQFFLEGSNFIFRSKRAKTYLSQLIDPNILFDLLSFKVPEVSLYLRSSTTWDSLIRCSLKWIDWDEQLDVLLRRRTMSQLHVSSQE